ncbi:flagellar hook-length control protein FliK [Methylovorus glucosotrophus]|uniref:flagellar hook-length control protein FliK n=1 Tax=Methylovorus glucosotrophus TaxID=266009 RepID=UPI0013315933|nr:flagellar hook-length control protein FliK [Methylovorus glucosotrophus]KAF0844655.1 flagellar hook-length control protein FliK [Methylovorus glucosotrophus]
MQIKLSDTPGVAPVSRVTQALPTVRVADTVQDVDFRFNQFIKGQDYLAQVMSRADPRHFNVEVGGTLLKMDLGSQARVGQNLTLRFLDETPTPTFQLMSSLTAEAEPDIALSSAARLIDSKLQEAQKQGVPTRFEATGIVSQSPQAPQQMAQDLKQALTLTGLFYESHLKSFAEGGRPLAAILQEPQNQPNSNAGTMLLPQQLSVLENSRVNWRGEVWPGQQMNWSVEVQQQTQQSQQQAQASSASIAQTAQAQAFNQPSPLQQSMLPNPALNQPLLYQPPSVPVEQRGNQQDTATDHATAQLDYEPEVSSELTLDLPQLGRVSARLRVVNGHMSIQLQAQQIDTLQTMRARRHQLFEALEQSGQTIDALVVVRDGE